jgi:hypothetical protein
MTGFGLEASTPASSSTTRAVASASTAAPASRRTGSTFFVAGFHASVEWQSLHVSANVSCPGNVDVVRSSAWHATHAVGVFLNAGGSPWWHQKHLTPFSLPTSSRSSAAFKCAPVSSYHG